MKILGIPEQSQSIALKAGLGGLTKTHERKILCWLARQTPGNILEIGCHKGGTTHALATTNPDKIVYAVDYLGADDTMHPRQKGEKPKPTDFCRLARDLPNVRPLLMKSAEIDYGQLEHPVNFIFIDGDHSHEGVNGDTTKALDHVLKVGGCVVWHDYVARHQDWMKVKEYLDELDQQLRKGHRLREEPLELCHFEGTWLVCLWVNDEASGLEPRDPPQPSASI